MLFSGIPFLYYFLPAAIALYFCTPARFRNLTLAAVSLFFYGYGEPRYVFLMAFAIAVGYALGILIERNRGGAAGRAWFWLSVGCGVGMLGYFKYADFFIANFNAATGLSLPLLNIALPIGVSFYTFQLLSYTIDVYRGGIPAQRSIVALAAYISMFPQLIAGPIVRYRDVMAQLGRRTYGFDRAAAGIRGFVCGLCKKVLIANALGELCEAFRASGEQSVLFYWIYALSFTLHIYFDFSGYSDMAIGLGRIFGFEFMENFNYPYVSKSVAEFWRRWHISLGLWFRDYVYIPLGGNRCSRRRWLFNIFAVWFLTGLWHGAEWSFIAWGLYFGALLVMEKLWLSKLIGRMGGFSRLYVMFIVAVGFVIFNAGSLGQAANDLACMFGLGRLPLVSGESLYCLRSYAAVMAMGAVGATPLPKRALEWLRGRRVLGKALDVAEPAALAALSLMATAYLVDGSFNPFLYFRF